MKNSAYILFLILLITTLSCNKDDLSFNLPKVIKLPILTTLSISDIKSSSAISGGEITFDGGAIITARGICYATTTLPTTSNKIIDSGTGDGNFLSTITGLLPNTTYYVRAYASNSEGTSYGNELIFKTVATIATVITTSPSNITSSSASSGGNVTNDGGAVVTSRGICFATNTTNPTILNNVINSGSGVGLFATNLIGLLPNTTYYVRAFATNSIGTSYGASFSFRTSATLATLSTTNASSITSTSAVSGGNITSDGGSTINSRGVCYSTTSNPTTTNNYILSGSGIGSFSLNISGLLPNTTYYARAFAINSSGTAYGLQISFITRTSLATLTTTSVSSISSSSATSGGNITSDGGYAVTSRGVCYSTFSNPSISNSIVNSGSGLGSFTSNLTGLSQNVTYYVRAFATNALGTAYGSQFSFTTIATLATLTTTSVSNITASSAISGGNVTSDGGYTVTSRGVCFATYSNPTISNSTVYSGTSIGSFTSNIPGLSQNTTYYVRAFATNALGTAYGSQYSFTTISGLPILTTTVATNISRTTVTTGGNITSSGSSTITNRGVCYARTSNPTTGNQYVLSGSGTGTFISSITSLLPNTTYYVRAFAINTSGTAYGTQISFKTSP